jgi:hypothetical protein
MVNDEMLIASMVAGNESEFEKMKASINGKKNRTNGFEGCKKCDFDGFYLCTYSREGLCDDCEYKEFPERFRGCLFCRRVLPMQLSICFECQSGFQSWLWCMAKGQEWNPKEYYASSDTITQGIFEYLEHHDMYRNFKAFILPHTNKWTDKWTEQWPGFYRGNNQWRIPTLDEMKNFDTSDITWENKAQVIKRELAKLSISIFSDIQIS